MKWKDFFLSTLLGANEAAAPGSVRRRAQGHYNCIGQMGGYVHNLGVLGQGTDAAVGAHAQHGDDKADNRVALCMARVPPRQPRHLGGDPDGNVPRG